METGEDKGFVIHTRRFRENSRILDLFTVRHGRMSLMARVSKKQALRKTILFQPFIEVDISWRGRGALPNLVSIEERNTISLKGKQMICGLYCNELLLYVLEKSVCVPDLYEHYKRTITSLACESLFEPVLRSFEGQILAESGQAIDFFIDCKTDRELEVNDAYYFQPGYGFSTEKPAGKSIQVTTTEMLSMQTGNPAMQSDQKGVKMVYQAAINHMLQNRQIRSRQLFRSL